ncbi:MAG: hypothetical protein ABFQ62_04845 [Patescibacteria group bacterium]
MLSLVTLKMNKRNLIQNQAIQAAKNQNWLKAIELNLQLLEENPKDISALNRLGVAYIQVGKKTKAKQSFQSVLKLEKSNTIAKKHLIRIKNNQTVQAPNFHQNQFIEEPGKTKTTQLRRLASKDLLSKLTVGQKCTIKLKNRHVSIEVDGKYIGSLPDDLSFRLGKLMKNGNEYSCWLRSINDQTCHVFLREIKRSNRNANTHSFSINKNNQNAVVNLDTNYVSKEALPVVLVNTDEDKEPEQSLSKIGEITRNPNELSP